MKFSIDKKEKYCVFKLQESKLNSLIAPKLKSEMVLLNAEGIKNIIIDLAEVQFIDSSGLSAILVGNRLSQDSEGSFVLTNINESIARLIKISQLQDVLNIIPTLPEAIDFVLMEELERDLKAGE